MNLDGVENVVFSPDGTRAVALFERKRTERKAQILDAETGHPIGDPLKLIGDVFSVAFSPDGTRIASGRGTAPFRCGISTPASPSAPR